MREKTEEFYRFLQVLHFHEIEKSICCVFLQVYHTPGTVLSSLGKYFKRIHICTQNAYDLLRKAISVAFQHTTPKKFLRVAGRSCLSSAYYQDVMINDILSLPSA